MLIPSRLSTLLLAITILSLKIENSHSRRWPYNSNQFPTERGRQYSFSAIPDWLNKRSAFEKILIHLKDIVSNSPTSEVPDNIKNHLSKFPKELDNVFQLVQKNSTHTARNFKGWLEELGTLISETNDTINGDVDYVGERNNGDPKTYEHFRSKTETIFDTITNWDDNLRAVVPETLWCGLGYKTYNKTEIELFAKAENCCQARDQCSFNIEADKRFGPLVNCGLFTTVACFCDREFYQCMTNAHDMIATKIAITYFSLLSPQCIGYDYPKVSCHIWQQDLEVKCVEPIVDRSMTKELQWFNTPDFK